MLHVPVGIVIAIVPGVLPLCFTALFIAYEISEDWRIKDHAYIDVQGALIGLAIGGGVRWLF